MSDYSNMPDFGFGPQQPQPPQPQQPQEPQQAPQQATYQGQQVPYQGQQIPYQEQPPYQQPQPIYPGPQGPFPGQQPPYPYQPRPRKGLGAGAIVGIVLGAIVLAGALAWLGFRFLSHKAAEEYITDYAEVVEAEVPETDVVDVDEMAVAAVEEDFAWLSQRRVEYSDIADMSLADRRILRNAIYARHGYIFKSDDLREYFSQFSWYTPRYTDVTGQLSELERDNVMFIKSYE